MRREDAEVLEEVGFRFKPDQRQRASKDRRDNKRSWVEEPPLDLDIDGHSWYKGSMENDTQPDSSETKPNQETIMNENTNPVVEQPAVPVAPATLTPEQMKQAAKLEVGRHAARFESFKEAAQKCKTDLRKAQAVERSTRGFFGRCGGVVEATGQMMADSPVITATVVTAAVVIGGCYAASQYTDFGQDFFGSSMADSSSDLSM